MKLPQSIKLTISLKNMHRKISWLSIFIIILIIPKYTFANNNYDNFYKIENNKVLTVSGRIWVIDGDSFTLTTKKLQKIEIRLFGINAPEMHTKLGKKAKRALINYIKNDNWIKCKIIGTDKYKRKVAQCFNKQGDLAEFLLKNGYARIFLKYIKKAPEKFIQKYKSFQKLGYRLN